MKRTLIFHFFILFTISLFTAGCGLSPDQSNQGEQPDHADNADEINFEENGGQEESGEMVFGEDEANPEDSAEEMVFGNDESILVTESNTPPGGTWLWTNSEPSYEGCPVDMSNAAPPPDPPQEVEIEINDKGDILFIYTGLGAVELYRSAFSETASAYEASIVIPVADGEDLEVEYYLDFNIFGNAEIGGTLTSLLPEFDGCQAIRGFSAVFIE